MFEEEEVVVKEAEELDVLDLIDWWFMKSATDIFLCLWEWSVEVVVVVLKMVLGVDADEGAEVRETFSLALAWDVAWKEEVEFFEGTWVVCLSKGFILSTLFRVSLGFSSSSQTD